MLECYIVIKHRITAFKDTLILILSENVFRAINVKKSKMIFYHRKKIQNYR